MIEKEITCKNCKVKFTTKVIYKDSREYVHVIDGIQQRNFHCNLRWDKVQYRHCELCRNMKKACNFLNRKLAQ